MVQMSQHKLPKRGNEGRDRFLEMLHHLNMLFIIPTYAYIYSTTGKGAINIAIMFHRLG